MAKDNRNSRMVQKPFRKFEALARKLLRVPKASVEDQERNWKGQHKKGEHK